MSPNSYGIIPTNAKTRQKANQQLLGVSVYSVTKNFTKENLGFGSKIR